MSQLDMFASPMLPVTSEMKRAEKRNRKLAERPSIDQRFAEFWKANPHVWDELKRLARARLDRGEKRIAVKALWEELRASLIRIDDGGGPEYKLNNDFTALYARKLVERHPEFKDVIEIRRRKGER